MIDHEISSIKLTTIDAQALWISLDPADSDTVVISLGENQRAFCFHRSDMTNVIDALRMLTDDKE